MAVDASIYSQIKPVDFLGQITRGYALGSQIADDKQTRAVNDAYKAGIITNPDGTTSVDRGKTLSALAQVGGKQYIGVLSGLSAIAKGKNANTPEQKEQRNQTMLWVFSL